MLYPRPRPSCPLPLLVKNCKYEITLINGTRLKTQIKTKIMTLNTEENVSRLRVCFIGAGNVATHLALTLACSQHEIVGVYSRTMISAETLIEKLASKGTNALATNRLEEIPDADVYIFSVKDQALASIVEIWPQSRRGGVALHTAGSLPMSAVASAAEHYGVLYPMQTFSKDKAMDFRSVTCFIESSDTVAETVTRTLVGALGSKCVVLASAERQYLHLAAVFACNFSNHMFALAYELLEQHGIEPECMKPLIAETAAKAAQIHPREGQTGPAQRGDEIVMNKHLAALRDTPDFQDMYRLISQSIMKRRHIAPTNGGCPTVTQA